MLRQMVLFAAALIAAAGSAFGQMRCDAVGPHRIHACVDAGEGPTLVLAAGAGQDSRTWSPLLESLSALGSVVTFDRPGLGQSPDVNGPRTPTLIARELREVLSSRLSNGGLWLSSGQPDRVMGSTVKIAARVAFARAMPASTVAHPRCWMSQMEN